MNIYLAGNDGREFAEVLALLKYPFRLCSYYYMGNAGGGRGMAQSGDVLEFAKDGSDWIMDSGLFSFMFGAEQGKLTTFDDYYAYAKKYVETLQAWGWKHAVVECDVQRVLGVAETIKIRDEIMRPSGFDIIYVWHLPEGEEGLRKLAATEKRIALSVPELRAVFNTGPTGGLQVKKALLHLIKVARDAGTARIHLLGNTESALMRLPADSCDSTSWLGAGRWGKGMVYRGGEIELVSIRSPRWVAWREWCTRTYDDAFVAIQDKYSGTGKKAIDYFQNTACDAVAVMLFTGVDA